MSVAALMVGMVLASQDPAKPQEPLPPATQIEDVLVEGRRLRDAIRDFVGEVAAPAGVRGPARWNTQVCVGVINLRADLAQFIVDRTSGIARELGVQAGEPGCTANVLVIAADDGRAIADGLVDVRRGAFRPGGSGMTRTLKDLEDFRTSDAPVRWWHISAPVDSESGELATRLPGYDAPVTNISRASRIRTDIRDDLMKVVIVVDVSKAAGFSLTQLADYIALVALAQIDPQADVSGYDSILNVFSEPTTPGLSGWDLDYLRALYSVQQNSVGAQARGAEIVQRMMRSEDEPSETTGSETPGVD